MTGARLRPARPRILLTIVLHAFEMNFFCHLDTVDVWPGPEVNLNVCR